jgi:hypothetical protein
VRGQHTVSINRAIEVVFAHIADGTNNAVWRTSVVEVSLHSGTRGEGTVWRQVVRGPAGKSADADYRVTRYDPPVAYGIEIIAGPVRGTALYTLSPGDDGETSVTLTTVLKPRGAMRLLTGFVLRQLVDDLDSLDRLRDLLNARGDNLASTPSV